MASIKSCWVLALFLCMSMGVLHSAEVPESSSLAERKLQSFRKSLDKIREMLYERKLPEICDRYNVRTPNIFISYAWEDDTKVWVDQVLSKDLQRLGFTILYDQDRILPGRQIGDFEEKVRNTTYVIMLCTPHYLRRYRDHDSADPQKSTGVGREVEKICQRLAIRDQGPVIPIWRKGGFGDSVPPIDMLRQIAGFSAQTEEEYYATIFKIAQTLFLSSDLHAEPIFSIQEAFFGRVQRPTSARPTTSRVFR